MAAALPSNPDAYLDQAARVRQSVDRPWAPASGQLGNLRRLHLAARDCVVRLVSGGENRVFPGAGGVTVVEESRIFDTDPNEQPPPRDVTLAADGSDPCPGEGQCGVSVTRADSAPRIGGAPVCFTVQIATPHDVSLRGDGVDLLVDGVRQPALRIGVGGNVRQRIWFEDVDLGLLSIRINAPVRIGGTGRVDWLNADSSNSASVAYLHGFRANRTGVSATTTRTQWSVRTGADTWAGYYQPARAPGRLADLYPIEIDGPVEALDVSASRVSARPITAATREASMALRAAVLQRAGPRPALVAANPALPTATQAARALPRSATQHVADVVARLLPPTVRVTGVSLFKDGGRVEGSAPDLETARSVSKILQRSGEFALAQGGGGPRDDGFGFSVVLTFHCRAPGQPSECPVGDPSTPGRYGEAQIRATLARALGPSFRIDELRIADQRVHLRGVAASGSDTREMFTDLRSKTGMFTVSSTTSNPGAPGGTQIAAVLSMHCTAPPRADGICAMPSR